MSLRVVAVAKHAADHGWHATGGREVVGRRGFAIGPNNGVVRVGAPVVGRRLAPESDEHWQLSQNAVKIVASDRSAGGAVRPVYVEDSASSFPTEESIFEFFHLAYRPPAERCA